MEEERRRRRKRKKNKKEGCERREKMEEEKKCDRPNNKVSEHQFDKQPSERMHSKKHRHAVVEKVDALELNERQRTMNKEKSRSE